MQDSFPFWQLSMRTWTRGRGRGRERLWAMMLMELLPPPPVQDHNISLFNFSRHFLKKKHHGTLCTARFSSAPSLLQIRHAKWVKNVYATKGNQHNNSGDEFRVLSIAPSTNLIDSDGQGNTRNTVGPQKDDDDDDVNSPKHDDPTPTSSTLSHDLRKADGSLEPVPADIVEDSEDSIDILKDSTTRSGADATTNCHSFSTNDSMEEEIDRDCVTSNQRFDSLDTLVVDPDDRSSHLTDVETRNENVELKWPSEPHIEIGERGEAIVKDVTVLPLKEGEDRDRKEMEEGIEDHLMFGWSERRCDEGSIMMGPREGKTRSDIGEEDEEYSDMEKLAQWEQEVFEEDVGKTADDYHRRADIFGMSGKAFVAEKMRDEAKSHIEETEEMPVVEDTL